MMEDCSASGQQMEDDTTSENNLRIHSRMNGVLEFEIGN